MAIDITSTNHRFDILRRSGDFMYIVLENISSCVLLLNRDMELQSFNNAMKTIFSNKPDEDLLYRPCGEAIGCAYQVEEAKECGKTSRCQFCELRLAALESYLHDKVIFKEHIERPFYNTDSEKVNKHLQFSTRLFRFDNERFIILIIEDISKFYGK